MYFSQMFIDPFSNIPAKTINMAALRPFKNNARFADRV
jgi:hypothetical protein